jgi:NAD(P)-dependent dehydrogenase (short-subunit alcohol dehydrogenase family)
MARLAQPWIQTWLDRVPGWRRRVRHGISRRQKRSLQREEHPPMAGRLAGKVALVTGGGGGIGEATARLFWEEGASVAIVDLDGDAAATAARGIDASCDRVLSIQADLTIEAEAECAVNETVERFGTLDVLANIAAVRVHGPVTEATAESWDFVIKVNLLAVAFGCKYAIPVMAQNGGGSIVTVSSANATVGRPSMGQYDATKNAVLALTRSMACDHADQGIRVNAISPGPTLTPYHVRNRVKRTGETMEEAEPHEMAYAMLFLASDESSYVTGANFAIDGGIMGLRD